MTSGLILEVRVYSFSLSIISIILGQSYQSDIFIQHPELPQYFEKISKTESQFDSGRLLHFLGTNEKIVRCQETLAAVIYRSLPSDDRLPPASNPSIGELLNDVEDLYEREVLKGIQLIQITLQLPGRVVLVPALPCILDEDFSWFITIGFQTKEFFILEKEAADKNFHVHGITEPGPVVDEETSFDQLRMEIHFLRNFRAAAHKIQKRHFCNLENIQKLRLCSSAHFVWRKEDGQETFQANSVYEDASICVENAVLWFEKIMQENTGFIEPIKITLLSCAINSPLTEPQFYLAADQNNLNAAYILQKRHTESEAEVLYQLFLRITNISPLRKEGKIIPTLFEYEMSE